MRNSESHEDLLLYVAGETQGHFFVGLSPDAFLKEFMPWNSSTSPFYMNQLPDEDCIARLRAMSQVKNGGNTSRMCRTYIKAIDSWVTTDNNQNLRFSAFKEPDVACNNLNVDVSTYWENDRPRRNTFSLHQTQTIFRTSYEDDAFCHQLDEWPESAPQPYRVMHEDTSDWEGNDADQQAEDCDKQEDRTSEMSIIYENNTAAGARTRGELAACAGAALSMSFRSHLFSMLIIGPYARFVRWDRVGAVVTHRFDYVRRPDLIFDFYRRYGQLSDQQRGFDATVTEWSGPLPGPVADAFNSYYRDMWHGGAKFKDIPNGEMDRQQIRPQDRFFCVSVTDNVMKRTDEFIVPAPRFHIRYCNPFSRGTRCSLACPLPKTKNLSDKLEMCFIKESWHNIASRVVPEADIYRRLKEYKVENVASMRLGGDVEGLRTKTQEYVGDTLHPTSYQWFGQKVCHRLVLETVARDLSTFGWAKVLISCIADAVQTVQQAYKAGILHGDISAGNIMIVRDKKTHEWRGVLMDWDMCKLLDGDAVNRHSETMGTWAFMSANILKSKTPIAHTLADDLESALWVIIYESLRYLRHDRAADEAQFSQLFTTIFSRSPISSLHKTDKLALCAVQRSASCIASFEVEDINHILNALAKVFDQRYIPLVDNTQAIVDLDNPDNQWMVELLRTKALDMKPRNITPTGLKSPTENSQPPVDKALWRTASANDSALQFKENSVTSGTGDPTKTQNSAQLHLTTYHLNYMDGSSNSFRHTGSTNPVFPSLLPDKRGNNEVVDRESMSKKIRVR